MVLEVRDLLWLLLPVAAASGWYVAQRDKHRPSTPSLPPDYFCGINYLLNEQPDKAIEVFTRMLEVNTETVETHLALGSLFRRRGEVERAIRIHQNIIARPTLDDTQRSQALGELAQDYLKAGLLDRAEDLFRELAEIPLYLEQALRALMVIYEQEKDWEKAIATGYRLSQTNGQGLEPELAHYYCEMGEAALRDGNSDLARKKVSEALAVDKNCARANILMGKVAVACGDERAAITAWQKVEQQNAALLDEVIEAIAAAFRNLNLEGQLYTYLGEVVNRKPGIRTLLLLTELISNRDGPDAAQTFFAERLRLQPSLQGLKHLIDLQVAQGPTKTAANIDRIKDVLDNLALLEEGYQCGQCGFHGHILHWQCPACHKWNSVQAAARFLRERNLGPAVAEHTSLATEARL